MSTIIGKIATTEGTFYVKGLDGSLREVSEGYEILEGESIVGDKSNSSANSLVVSMADGTDIVILGKDKQLFDSSLSAQEFAQEDTVTEKDSIQSMLEENGDIVNAENIEDLETAAGEEAAETTEGGEAVFIDANNASADINADLRDRAFEDENIVSTETPIATATTIVDANNVTTMIYNDAIGYETSGNVIDTDIGTGILTVTSIIFNNQSYILAADGTDTSIALDYGTLTINSSGAYTYSADNDNSDVQALNVGESLSDGILYTVSDGTDIDMASLDLTILSPESTKDNVLVYSADTTEIDLGDGYDTIVINSEIDLAGLNGDNISNIEAINLSDGAQDISLSLQDVVGMTDENNILRISGDSADNVYLDATNADGSTEWTSSGELVTDAEQEYQVYTNIDETVTLQVSTEIHTDLS